MAKSRIIRPAGALALAFALLAIGFSLWQFWRFQSGMLLSDFRAFYCAADLIRHGVDSYRQEPLYHCEARFTAAPMWRAEGNVTDPAPLPPYALAIFAPLTVLPYVAAAALYSALLLAAWIAVVVCCRRLTQYSWILCGSAVIFAAMMSISLGQIAPLAIAAICVAALALRDGRDAWAGAAAAVAMIEPHVALPVCLALFAGAPRSRIALLAVGAALLAITALFGWERNAEYILHVLPAHQRSDVSDVGQFSVTVLAHALNFSDAAASSIGTVWYALSALAGIAVAVTLTKRGDARALLALIPMAFAVFGGSYVHWQQVVGAIPAALLLARSQRAPSPLLAAAVVALAIPWLYVVGWGFLIPGAAAIAAVIVCEMLAPSAIVVAFVGVAVFVALLMINRAQPHTPPQPPFVAGAVPSDWADLSWGQYVRARIPVGTGIYFWLHFPTWAGLAAVAGVALRRTVRVKEAPN